MIDSDDDLIDTPYGMMKRLVPRAPEPAPHFKSTGESHPQFDYLFEDGKVKER